MKQILDDASQFLVNGQVILYPTDTIWGLGCDATNAEAISKIYEIKQRPSSKNFIIFFPNLEMLSEYLSYPMDLSFFEANSEPTTYIIQQKMKLPSALIAADNSTAVRIPKNELCIQLMLKIGKPIVSTSANISGEPSPNSYGDIDIKVKKSVDFIVPESYFVGTGIASKIKICKNNNWETLR